MAKRVRIFGFDDLAQKLTTMTDPKEIGKILRAGVSGAMNDVKKRAAQLIPVGSVAHRTYKGRLVAPGFAKRSLKVVTRVDKSGFKASAVLGVRTEAFYAIQFVELGTSKMPARPWLRTAFSGSKDPSVRKIADGFNDWIKGLAARHAAVGNQSRADQLLEGI